MAKVNIGFCEKDIVNYIEILEHYKIDRINKAETIINKCNNSKLKYRIAAHSKFHSECKP